MKVHNRSELMSKILKHEKKFRKRLKVLDSIPWIRWNIKKPNLVQKDSELNKISERLGKLYQIINTPDNQFCFQIMSKL